MIMNLIESGRLEEFFVIDRAFFLFFHPVKCFEYFCLLKSDMSEQFLNEEIH